MHSAQCQLAEMHGAGVGGDWMEWDGHSGFCCSLSGAPAGEPPSGTRFPCGGVPPFSIPPSSHQGMRMTPLVGS